jgi:hypothetical protein
VQAEMRHRLYPARGADNSGLSLPRTVTLLSLFQDPYCRKRLSECLLFTQTTTSS